MTYAKLRGKIREVFGTNRKFGIAMNMDPSVLSSKLNRKTQWKEDEIARACYVLGIPIEEVWLYFFNEKVVKEQP